MLRAALTGGIATGKSRVRRRLAALGVATIDADALVHEALGPGAAGARAVARRFGDAFLAPDGSVDRRRLGTLVFEDDAARRDLEALLHPLVYAEVDRWFAARAADGASLGVADIPLLYETGHEDRFDVVIVVACAPDEQVRRVMQRDGLTAEAAARRVAAQMPIDEKARRADYLIRTTGSLDETDRRADELHGALLRRL
jgi:dephospho-CoA kinase